MNKGIIITLPRYEFTVNYLTVYSKKIIEEANKKNIKIKELKEEEANKKYFEDVLKSLDYKMIIFNGHGSEEAISGHKGELIIQNGINDSLLKGRISYARSCWAGRVLGKCMEDDKEGCFIGYELPFMFYYDEMWVANPYKDKIAPIFLEPSNLIPISLIKGNTSLQAHEKSKSQTLKTIKRILRSGNKESFLFAEKLWNNYIGQVIIGNKSAVL